MLDMETPIFDHDLSLQTLHRMPSETWEHRPVSPTFFFTLILLNSMLGNWSASDRFAKTVIRFAEMVIRIICKNGDQICRNGDQNQPQKCHLQFSVIRFAVFSDQIHKAQKNWGQFQIPA